jgi:hypothetical protein
MLEERSILWYELIGMVFIILLGSMLHFTFEWSGNQPIVGVFSAVNESVWEHLKIAFWPSLLFLIIEYRYLYKKSNNFFVAKTLGIYSMMIIIPLIFYSYTTFLEENLIIDIGSFIFAIIINLQENCQDIRTNLACCPHDISCGFCGFHVLSTTGAVIPRPYHWRVWNTQSFPLACYSLLSTKFECLLAHFKQRVIRSLRFFSLSITPTFSTIFHFLLTFE